MPRILLVDDDEVVRRLLGKILVHAQYEVEEAPNGAIALEAFRRRPHDLVITDIVMPEKEGLETLRELRQHRNVKVIAISGGGLGPAEGYLEVARRLGATRIVMKPFSPEQILQVIADVLATPQ